MMLKQFETHLFGKYVYIDLQVIWHLVVIIYIAIIFHVCIYYMSVDQIIEKMNNKNAWFNGFLIIYVKFVNTINLSIVCDCNQLKIHFCSIHHFQVPIIFKHVLWFLQAILWICFNIVIDVDSLQHYNPDKVTFYVFIKVTYDVLCLLFSFMDW